MKRRGFLGMMGGAAVAGPAMAKQAAAQLAGLTAPDVLGTGANLAQNVGYAIPTGSYSLGPDAEWDPLADAKKDLARLLGKSASEMAKERRGYQVTSLDPDLAVARSFSLDFKYRAQQSRLQARMMEHERTWIERRIADLISKPPY